MLRKITIPLMACGLLALGCAGCTAETVVKSPPPPDREEAQPAAPSAEHFWVRGHWQWNGQAYVWAPGRWETRRANEVWVAGHWRNKAGEWVWIDGRWTAR